MEDYIMGYARKDVEETRKYHKKFVRYKEGAEKYSLGLTKFQELAKEAKAVYKVDKIVLHDWINILSSTAIPVC